MGRHRTPQTRRAHRAIIAAAATAGISSALVLGHATNYTAANLDVDLTATVLGLGGRGDPTSGRVQDKLRGQIGPGFSGPKSAQYGQYKAVGYPADLNFQNSQKVGSEHLEDAIDAASAGHIRIVAYSEGTLVAEEVKRRLAEEYADTPKNLPDIDFLFIASPYVPNGGLFARFPGFRVPGLLPEFSPAEATGFHSTYVTNEYDTYADFPAYFNPLSIANALLSIRYAHPDQYYDDINIDDLPEGSIVNEPVPNGRGGYDTYILVRAEHLPLLGPVREVAALLHVTALTEPVLAAIEPILRLAVDAGYTDRSYANAATPTPFSLFTPPRKIVEALQGVPGALQEGAEDAASAGQDPSSATLTTPDIDNRQQRTAQAPDLEIAPDPQPSPKLESGGSSVNHLVDPDEAEPQVKTKPRPTPVLDAVAKAVRQIVRPTVTQDGSKAVPGTTGVVSTTTTGDGQAPTNPASGPIDSGVTNPPTAGGTPANTDPSPQDKAA